MYKILVFLKRKPGLSMQQFKDYYESTHAKLGDKYLRENSTKYIRRYLEPIGHPAGDTKIESEFDCVTEMWFKDPAQWTTAAAKISAPEDAKIVTEDEERFMDRSKMRMYTVDEHTSWGPT